MKKLFILFIFPLLLVNCNDDYLDKYPVTSLVEETAFETYDNFKAFMWPCYGMFKNGNILTSVNVQGLSSHYLGDWYAGYLVRKTALNPYAYQTITETTTSGAWNFSTIRRINIMLSNIDDTQNLNEDEKNHWRAVGYFFHSYWYMMLINRFGDIPWVDQVLDDNSDEAYGPREDRKVVADKILERLKWAEENIGDFTQRDGENTINQDAVRAAISRFTLREGTWRKYHGLGDYEKYFTECARVSKLLMDAYPNLYYGTDGQPAAGYGEMWTTEDLGTVPGVILHKQYLQGYLEAAFSYREHTSGHDMALHQDVIDLYLCNDGKTIYNSELYNGDKDIYATFRNRDARLYHTVMPPFKINPGRGDYPTWSFTENEADREYIDIMGVNSSCSNPGIGMKRLPAQNWTAAILKESPNILGVSGTSYISSYSGYYLWKSYDQWELNDSKNATNTADKPIFKIEEVLLNYAECLYEQGSFNQVIADQTINKLRDRAGVGRMVVSEIDADFDPSRDKGDPSVAGDYEVDPVLWEIRRERIIELMGEGFGFNDVRRWKKAHWMINKQPKGFWTNKGKAGRGLLNEQTRLRDNSLTEGYAFLFPDPVNTEGKGWLEKYYLYQVPTDEIVINPNLDQNPGWN